MPISEQVISFRRNRASELEQFARVLNKLGYCDPYPIYNAAEQLKDLEFVPKVTQNDNINYDFWGYDISNLTFN